MTWVEGVWFGCGSMWGLGVGYDWCWMWCTVWGLSVTRMDNTSVKLCVAWVEGIGISADLGVAWVSNGALIMTWLDSVELGVVWVCNVWFSVVGVDGVSRVDCVTGWIM